MPPKTAEDLIPFTQEGGLTETQAGERLADYIEGVIHKTGLPDAADLDIFDSNGLERGKPAPDPEDASASSPDSSGTEERAEHSDAEDEGEDAGVSSEEEDQQDQEDEDTQDDATSESLGALELAQLLGVEESDVVIEDDGSFKLRYRVNDEQGTATLAEVLRGYQTERNVTQKSEQLSEERRQLANTMAQRDMELREAVAQAHAFQQVMEKRVLDRYANIDWEQLKQEEPGRAAMLQVEMSTEVQAIRSEAAQLRQQIAHQQQQAQEQMRAEHINWMAEEQKRLFQHLPDLADKAKRPEILNGYMDYLMGLGFRPEEVQSMHDHRYLRVVADAVAYRKLQSEAQETKPAPVKKRLRKVPKVARGGARRGPQEEKGDRLKQVRRRLRDSGSDIDAADFAVAAGIVDHML